MHPQHAPSSGRGESAWCVRGAHFRAQKLHHRRPDLFDPLARHRLLLLVAPSAPAGPTGPMRREPERLSSRRVAESRERGQHRSAARAARCGQRGGAHRKNTATIGSFLCTCAPSARFTTPCALEHSEFRVRGSDTPRACRAAAMRDRRRGRGRGRRGRGRGRGRRGVRRGSDLLSLEPWRLKVQPVRDLAATGGRCSERAAASHARAPASQPRAGPRRDGAPHLLVHPDGRERAHRRGDVDRPTLRAGRLRLPRSVRCDPRALVLRAGGGGGGRHGAARGARGGVGAFSGSPAVCGGCTTGASRG